jgi:hypothetical protein
VLESGPNWVHLHWPSTSFFSSSTLPPSSHLAYLVEMRELGEPGWVQLADQQISPIHSVIGDENDGGGGGQHRVPVTTTMDHFIGRFHLLNRPKFNSFFKNIIIFPFIKYYF